MYATIVIALLFVLPLVSTLVEVALTTGDIVSIAGKWLVFWAVGVRFVMAGVKQVLQPAFTAQTIFRLTNEAAFPIVREVGFGNLSMGALGLLSLAMPAWTVPAALVGGLYYVLAGLGHVANTHRNAHEQTAMITDIVVGILLLAFTLTRSF
jgi:hypothetical protein